MHVTVEPPLAQWSVGDSRYGNRADLVALARRAADVLDTAPLGKTDRLIATGHQAALWHPGILAKDIAVACAARRFDAGMCHVVVDQDVHPTMQLDLPISRDGRLWVESFELASVSGSVPTGSQPAADVQTSIEVLADARRRHGRALAADVQPIMDALGDLPSCQTLAEQVAVLTERLMRPYVGAMPLIFAGDLLSLPASKILVEQMLADLPRCIECYNAAAVAHPKAGINPLAIEPGRCELPLWLLRFGRPRLRVYGQLTASAPTMIDEQGCPIGDDARLAPKALMLTALMRSVFCDLFVHGKGGRVYDRVTEQWWDRWLGHKLAPMAMVTADAHLEFDAPVSSRMELAQAVWQAWHLPHNIDRCVPAEELTDEHRKLACRKRSILAHMDDDRDRRRRAQAFAELHKINDIFVQHHLDLIRSARKRSDLARLGAANTAVAGRRDWCFGIYPDRTMRALAEQLAGGNGA